MFSLFYKFIYNLFIEIITIFFCKNLTILLFLSCSLKLGGSKWSCRNSEIQPGLGHSSDISRRNVGDTDQSRMRMVCTRRGMTSTPSTPPFPTHKSPSTLHKQQSGVLHGPGDWIAVPDSIAYHALGSILWKYSCHGTSPYAGYLCGTHK